MRPSSPVPHPGEVLQKEFLEPRGMTQTELARRLEVPYQRVNQIVNRRRAVTPDTALRLARLFATSPEFWLELQLRWELSEAEVQAPAPAVVRERAAWTASAAILDEIVARLVEVVDPQKIVLFGSSVTGEAGPRSDVDLLVVDRETFGTGRSRRRQLARIHGALSGLGIAKDILLYSADEVDRWRRSPNHIIARALEQGRVLYERS